jgi:predicted Zn-dependent protease
VAGLACAWFVLSGVQAVNTNRAAEVVSGSSISRAHARQARRWLATAATLNPDQTVNILRGELAYAEGRDARALDILTSVTRAEPQNLEAWLALAHRAGHQPNLFRAALHRIAQLLPPVPHR